MGARRKESPQVMYFIHFTSVMALQFVFHAPLPHLKYQFLAISLQKTRNVSLSTPSNPISPEHQRKNPDWFQSKF